MDERMRGTGPMTACGVFPDEVSAERAVVDLFNAGFQQESISVSMVDESVARRLAQRRGIMAGKGAVPASLPQEVTRAYREQMTAGGVLLTVSCGDKCQMAMDVINKNGAEMAACALEEMGAPPIILHEPDQYASMEHLPQAGEEPGKPGEFQSEFHRDDLKS